VTVHAKVFVNHVLDLGEGARSELFGKWLNRLLAAVHHLSNQPVYGWFSGRSGLSRSRQSIKSVIVAVYIEGALH
jgi:hypothetical protein